MNTTENWFYKYFKDHYCNRLEQWASCFRKKTLLNTNMFLEAFHRTLKVVYMQQKQNRRIDFLLHILLKIAKDKVFDHITKLEKGKYTHRVSEINKPHKSATNMCHLKDQVLQKNETTWMVPSEIDQSLRYRVELVNSECSCQLCCSTCKVCKHTYSCTCMDATMHATVCKHVHLVNMTTKAVVETAQNIKMQTHTQTKLNYFSKLLDDGEECEVSKLHQKLLHKVSELSVLLRNCKNIDDFRAARNHITSAMIALKSHTQTNRSTILPIKRKIVPNQNYEKQPRFFSTKKKESDKTKESSLQDINRTLVHLQKQEITCCAICYKENDNSTNDYINWVQCSSMKPVHQEQLIHMTSYVKHVFLVLAKNTFMSNSHYHAFLVIAKKTLV